MLGMYWLVLSLLRVFYGAAPEATAAKIHRAPIQEIIMVVRAHRKRLIGIFLIIFLDAFQFCYWLLQQGVYGSGHSRCYVPRMEAKYKRGLHWWYW